MDDWSRFEGERRRREARHEIIVQLISFVLALIIKVVIVVFVVWLCAKVIGIV